MRPPLIALVLAAAVALMAPPVFAEGAWEFYGGAGINAGRADNPRFAGTRQANPGYDPNNVVCLGPNDPAHDPNVYDPGNTICDETVRVAGSQRRSDFTGSARLTGGLRGTWAGTSFDLAYSPVASFFYEARSLGEVSHGLASNWRHAYTPRSTASLNTTFSYTPEQDVDPNNLQQGTLLTGRTSRTHGSFRGSLAHQATARSSFDWSYRYALRAFSSDEFVDSSDHNLGINWRRRVGPRAYVQSSYEYGVTFYSDGPNDPNAAPNVVPAHSYDSGHHRASVGWGIETLRGFTASLNAGYNVAVPFDSRLDSFSGLYANAATGWSGRFISTSGGYVRTITDGGGAFANAQADSLHATVRAAFTKTLSGDLALTHGVHERLPQGSAGTTGEKVRTSNARSALTWSFSRDWSINAAWTHYRQSAGGAGAAAPELRSNRYSAGIAWSVR